MLMNPRTTWKNTEGRSELPCVSVCAGVVLLVLGVGLSASAQDFKPDERFVGMLADGTRIHADSIKDWHDETAKPQFAGHSIFDQERPVRWMTDQAVALAEEPAAYIEFFGGDRLPCRVVDYERPSASAYESLGPYLVVEPLVPVDVPGRPATPFLRISPEWLKRVVFEKRPGVPAAWTPGTVFLHDGSRVSFRVVRWSGGGLALLTESGVRTLLYSQVSELHLPRRDDWDVYFEQLAVLTPDLSGRVIQAETSNGARVTASTQRFRAHHSGDRSKTENWYPLLHPAWSLDPITLAFRLIRTWRFFSPEQPPMWMFEPEARRDDPVFSAGWDWQRNLSVQSSLLRNSRQLAGWGFGVHAPTTLSFSLHPSVREVRCRAGIDQVVGNAGCVRAVMGLESQPGNPFYRSDILIGHQRSIDSGWKSVRTSPEKSDRLELKADPVIADRPKGADPFDIRDALDWLEPEWKLDRAALQLEVNQRLVDGLPALKGWTVSSWLPVESEGEAAPRTADADSALQVRNEWDGTISSDERVRLLIQPAAPFSVFTRSMKVGTEQRWLAFCLSRPIGEFSDSMIHVRIDGRTMTEASCPRRVNLDDPDPILVAVDEFQGKDVRVDVIILPQDERSVVDWRGVALCERPPGIEPLFDETDEMLESLTEGEGQITLVNEEPQHGNSALKLIAGDRVNPAIDGFEFAVREHPGLGQYRYLRFAWRKPAGDRIGFQLGHDNELGIPDNEFGRKTPRAFAPAIAAADLRRRRSNPRQPVSEPNRGARFGYQYDAGSGDPEESVMRLDRRLPERWTVNQRDLWGEFGSFTLTGLGFRSFDGKPAFFDQIYLARTQNDFRWIDEVAGLKQTLQSDDPVLVGMTGEPLRFGVLMSQVAPQFATSASGEPIQLLREHSGRKLVARTMPPSKEKACVLRSPVSVRNGKKTVLKISAGRYPDGNWQLVVRAAGDDIYRAMVDAESAKGGWLDRDVDLSRFAGKNIVVEVFNQANDWNYEHAFWQRLEVVEE